ncbi:MAG: thiosulfate oxidation carrier complex protein SoxZ [Proteobacteria bacterium]|nr:thiosulfate oxidation carrier complex protein SoxZ [Pseudomonadota bacterium]
MIKHPNNNGMQQDQESGGYLPARFIKSIMVTRSRDLVFKAETGTSIATNPNFRFTYANAAENALDVVAIDSNETKFTASSGKMVEAQ